MGTAPLLLVAFLSCARCRAGDPGVAPPPRRLLIKGADISEPEAPGHPVLLRGFNLDFKLGSDYPYPIAQDRALKTLLPGANLVRLVMNHWHDNGGHEQHSQAPFGQGRRLGYCDGHPHKRVDHRHRLAST